MFCAQKILNYGAKYGKLKKLIFFFFLKLCHTSDSTSLQQRKIRCSFCFVGEIAVFFNVLILCWGIWSHIGNILNFLAQIQGFQSEW